MSLRPSHGLSSTTSAPSAAARFHFDDRCSADPRCWDRLEPLRRRRSGKPSPLDREPWQLVRIVGRRARLEQRRGRRASRVRHRCGQVQARGRAVGAEEGRPGAGPVRLVVDDDRGAAPHPPQGNPCCSPRGTSFRTFLPSIGPAGASGARATPPDLEQARGEDCAHASRRRSSSSWAASRGRNTCPCS